MTKEEAKYYYNKYAQAYDEAKRNKNKAAEAVEAYRFQKNTAESDLLSCKSEKKNLEQRLGDVKDILALLEDSIPSYIIKANCSAMKAEEKYTAAIKCSLIINASIKTAYRTKSVMEDSNSENTYQQCLNEKKRLEKGIQDLNYQINSLNSKIAVLTSNIHSYTNMQDACGSDMNTYRNKANYYSYFL